MDELPPGVLGIICGALPTHWLTGSSDAPQRLAGASGSGSGDAPAPQPLVSPRSVCRRFRDACPLPSLLLRRHDGAEALTRASIAGRTDVVAALTSKDGPDAPSSNHRLRPRGVEDALCLAARWRRPAVMRLLMEWEEPRTREAYGLLLAEACCGGDLQCISLVLSLPPHLVPLERVSSGDALILAAGRGHMKAVKHFLKWPGPGPGPRADCQDGEALCEAALHGQVKIMRTLLSNRAHAPRADCQNGMALLNTVSMSQHVEAMITLLSWSKHAPRADCRNGEVLVEAARRGYTHAMTTLLTWPIHAPRADCGGEEGELEGEALVEAARNGCMQAMCLLLSWPEHAPRADCQEGEALVAAANEYSSDVFENHSLCQKPASRVCIMRTLLDWPEYAPRADCQDGEALVRAASCGHLDEMRLLLAFPRNPPRADCQDGEALLAAAACGDVGAITMLLEWPEHAPKANVRDGEALVQAASNGALDAMRCLLNWPDSAPTADCQDGWALVVAAQNGMARAMRLLLEWPHRPALADCRHCRAVGAADGFDDCVDELRHHWPVGVEFPEYLLDLM